MKHKSAARPDSMESATEQFTAAMRQEGLLSLGGIIADGKIHRFAAPGQKDKNCWYVFHGDHGAFGDWSSGMKEAWCQRTGGMSDAKRHDLYRKVDVAHCQHEAKERQKHERRADELAAIWEKLPTEGNSPYCQNKQVENFGCRYGTEDQTVLMVPGRDAESKLWQIQAIDAKGVKRFQKDARVRGCFHIVGTDNLNGLAQIIVAEGYATAASIYMATGIVAVAAFDAGNLEPAIAAIKAKHPAIKIVIGADDDIWKPEKGNKGRDKAVAAAKKHNCDAVFPVFKDGSTKPTDFNDLHRLEGLEAVKNTFSAVTGVTDVTLNESNKLPVTPEPESDVTANVMSDDLPIPGKEDRPCYRVFDTLVDTGKQKFRSGVWYFYMTKGTQKEPPTPAHSWICSPLHIDAITFDAQDNNFGRLLRFRNTAGRWREWAMPMSLLSGSGEELRGELLSMGVEIDYNSRVQLASYIQSRHPQRRVHCATQTGWCDGCFVLPDNVIGTKASDITFQSGERLGDEYTSAGTLEGWKSGVAALAIGNPMLIATLSSAFAGVMLAKCNAESGGLHLVGDSSTGKTGLVEAACSVWGGENHKRSWRSTANGMEGVCALFNDNLLPLDEISECDPREVGAIVYSLGNGRGKQRAGRTGNARSVKRWRCFVLSSGERTVETSMAEGGFRAKAGQSARLPNLPVTRKYGVWDDLHGMESGAAFTDAIKQAAKKHCGHAGRAFLERLTRDSRDFCALLERIKALPTFSIEGAEGQVKRVTARFALLALAGELAIEYGIVPWPEETAINAAVQVLQAWYAGHGSRSNGEQQHILEKLSDFIQRHGDSRFSNADAEKPDSAQIRDRAGWWRDKDGKRVYLFTAEGMREALKGFDYLRGLDALQAAGALHVPEGSKERAKRQRIGGRLMGLYTIDADKLEADHGA